MHKILNLVLAAALAAATPAFAGGEHDHGPAPAADAAHGADEEAPSVAVTQWTPTMELFMEYPVPVSETPGRFIIHLTVLDGFQPVREGSVSLAFTGPDGSRSEVVAGELLREGIFAPTVTLTSPGPHAFELSYSGPGVSSVFEIGGFVVHASQEEIPPTEDDGSADEIGFLKEQQWKIPFETQEVAEREISHTVWAIGEVLPAASSYVEIVAPVSGILQVGEPAALALPGSWVDRGDVVTRIIPPVQGDSWAASEIALAQAERNYERARRLREKEAISTREFEEAENEYRARKAGHERLAGSGDDGVLTLNAPIDGQVIDWQVRPGQRVEAGDLLMAIVDPSVVWLKVNVYQTDLDELGVPVGAYIGASHGDGAWMVPDSDLRVLSTGGALDPVTRTVPVLLEVANPEGLLTINGSTPVELITSRGEPGIAVPVSAVYEDEGFAVVYAQTGGETFEKRLVTVGHRHAGWVSIEEGVRAGDRIVVRGGYHVKLASTSAAVGAGHAH